MVLSCLVLSRLLTLSPFTEKCSCLAVLTLKPLPTFPFQPKATHAPFGRLSLRLVSFSRLLLFTPSPYFRYSSIILSSLLLVYSTVASLVDRLFCFVIRLTTTFSPPPLLPSSTPSLFLSLSPCLTPPRLLILIPILFLFLLTPISRLLAAPYPPSALYHYLSSTSF